MSGYDIFKKALLRLSYTKFENNLSVKALEFINQICIDLKLPAVENLSQEMNLSADIAEAVCCGLAMLLSLSEGDSEKNRIYTNMYNSKRAAVLSKTTYVEDVLPNFENGGE